MTAINHALTGVTLSLYIDSAIALPLSLASHFLLDAVPHFGMVSRNKKFVATLVVDSFLVITLVLFIVYGNFAQPIFMLSCLALAVLPDIAWGFRWYKESKYGANPNIFYDPITKFHSKIQWFEKPIGLIVEIFWLMAMLCLMAIKVI